MASNPNPSRKLTSLWGALIEFGFIVFLFYSNLFMREFTRANSAGKSLAFTLKDIFSLANFIVAVVAALIGYVVLEFLRKQL